MPDQSWVPNVSWQERCVGYNQHITAGIGGSKRDLLKLEWPDIRSAEHVPRSAKSERAHLPSGGCVVIPLAGRGRACSVKVQVRPPYRTSFSARPEGNDNEANCSRERCGDGFCHPGLCPVFDDRYDDSQAVLRPAPPPSLRRRNRRRTRRRKAISATSCAVLRPAPPPSLRRRNRRRTRRRKAISATSCAVLRPAPPPSLRRRNRRRTRRRKAISATSSWAEAAGSNRRLDKPV